MVKYKIELTEKQARVFLLALEEYFRLRLGQVSDFSLDLAMMNYDTSSDDADHNKDFDKRIQIRDAINEVMKSVMRIAFGYQGTPDSKTDDMMIAECMWDALRVKAGISRCPFVLEYGLEPVPQIEVIKE